MDVPEGDLKKRSDYLILIWARLNGLSGKVEDKARTLVPNAKIIVVSETPIDGILQVQINSDIVYMSTDGQYLFQGQIMDIDARTNITDQAKAGLRLELLDSLDSEDQISFAPE